jgi:hypothetical protein
MTRNIAHKLFLALIVSLLAVAMHSSAFGQGRSGGRGGGAPTGAGGPPSGTGVDRGLGRSSDASAGRADTGRGTASDRSNGRSDAGLDRARTASENLHNANKDLQDHPGIATSLHTNANDLRAAYQAALATNPNLKFGQFVAATRLAQNLGSRDSAITRDAILAGLAAGKSIGQTLQDLGLSKSDANEAVKEADRENKQSRKG